MSLPYVPLVLSGPIWLPDFNDWYDGRTLISAIDLNECKFTASRNAIEIDNTHFGLTTYQPATSGLSSHPSAVFYPMQHFTLPITHRDERGNCPSMDLTRLFLTQMAADSQFYSFLAQHINPKLDPNHAFLNEVDTDSALAYLNGLDAETFYNLFNINHRNVVHHIANLIPVNSKMHGMWFTHPVNQLLRYDHCACWLNVDLSVRHGPPSNSSTITAMHSLAMPYFSPVAGVPREGLASQLVHVICTQSSDYLKDCLTTKHLATSHALLSSLPYTDTLPNVHGARRRASALEFGLDVGIGLDSILTANAYETQVALLQADHDAEMARRERRVMVARGEIEPRKGKGRPPGARNILTGERRLDVVRKVFPPMADNALRMLVKGHALDHVRSAIDWRNPTRDYTTLTPLLPESFFRLPVTAVNYQQVDSLLWRGLIKHYRDKPIERRNLWHVDCPVMIHIQPFSNSVFGLRARGISSNGSFNNWAMAHLAIPLPTFAVAQFAPQELLASDVRNSVPMGMTHEPPAAGTYGSYIAPTFLRVKRVRLPYDEAMLNGAEVYSPMETAMAIKWDDYEESHTLAPDQRPSA